MESTIAERPVSINSPDPYEMSFPDSVAAASLKSLALDGAGTAARPQRAVSHTLHSREGNFEPLDSLIYPIRVASRASNQNLGLLAAQFPLLFDH